ncbi:MAG: hypothetical protein WCR51_08770 [Planctomycetia bacterium]
MNHPLHEPPSDTPAAALGPTWDLLDSLPRAATPPSMTSTTLEMVAAAARTQPRRSAWWRGWLGPVTVVGAAFVAGVVAGRATVTDPEKAVFEYLPVLEHYDVLKEAGSVEFLTEVARRNYPPPRRFAFGRGGEAVAPAFEALDAAVATFASASFGPDAGSTAERRAELSDRPAEERRQLSDAAVEFQRLSPVDRRDLVRLARVFGGRDGEGPDRDELLEAARLWHQWLANRDPADRKGVIDLGTTERLEWLDHYALMRPGSGRGPYRDGGGFRGFPPPDGPPEGPPPGGPRFNGRPPEGPRRGPPPPGETPGPPR